MAKRLAPAFIDLTRDALWRAYWYKKSLRRFLQQHGISQSVLACWHTDQTKIDYIDWLFGELVGKQSGRDCILSMARSLAGMEHFPDLERREDTKDRVAAAHVAVARLRTEVSKLDEVQREEREAREHRKRNLERIQERNKNRLSLQQLETRLTDLMPSLGNQTAGYDFEKWFYDLALFCEVDSRPSYNADGRQIDGSVTIEGTTFLIETKFTRKPIGSSDVDVFMSKIESKADNTMGIMISISGFTSGAIKTASKQRTPMLLLDHGHLYGLILRAIMTLPQVISRVKRHASQTGKAYLAASEF